MLKNASTTTTTTNQNPNHNPTQKTNPQQTPKKSAHTKKPTTTTKQKQRTQKQLAANSLLYVLKIQKVFFYQITKIFPDSHQFGIKKYWLYSLCCFVLPLPNLSLAVKIFSVANSREAIYIMTIVKIAT